eukprot:CAMPEP_0115044272 /NCGR_PEP_ID=MMETSP0216-20121206/47377_1 /TAXON_ID=223996 /ORGANISM="Protocruzia adherens, Strain Boccale" /LENGTH=421 /DNA_ID=CAMNT_0002426775 /DNA_START=40 /DNA_END=1305 /DNA_ORIENTATION=+
MEGRSENYTNLLQQLSETPLFRPIPTFTILNATLNHFKNPHKTYKTIHIAGTNGKGSTATKIASTLQNAGYTVGLFTSPHIHCFCERFQVNGQLASEEMVTQRLGEICQYEETTQEKMIWFEKIFVLACLVFRESEIDYGVIECGLGGLHDSTNVIQAEISVITTIGLDHCELLGSTEEEIAAQKAGIIKTASPVVLGCRLPRHVFENQAQKYGAQVYQIESRQDRSFLEENSDIVRLVFKILESNLGLKITQDALTEGLKKTPPCRMEEMSLDNYRGNLLKKTPLAVVLDVGHNSFGLQRLMDSLKKKYNYQKLTILFTMARNKDLKEALHTVLPQCSKMMMITSTHPRLNDFESLNRIACEVQEELNLRDVVVSDYQGDVQKSLEAALADCEDDELICATGSFFIMDACQKALGISQLP